MEWVFRKPHNKAFRYFSKYWLTWSWSNFSKTVDNKGNNSLVCSFPYQLSSSFLCAGVLFAIFKLYGNTTLSIASSIQSVKIWKVNPDCLSIWIGISPPEALLRGTFLIIFSKSLTETGRKFFSCIRYLVLILTILGWFLNFFNDLGQCFVSQILIIRAPLKSVKFLHRFCKMFVEGLSDFITH